MEVAGHEFEGVFEEHNGISDRRGVYIVLCLVDGEPHCVLDIGESSKVGNRLKTNKRKKCWRENVHGEIGFCVKYTSSKGGIENPRKYAPPAARKPDGEYVRMERHDLELELQWKFDYVCGSNPWKQIEQKYETYKAYEDEFGPRASHQV